MGLLLLFIKSQQIYILNLKSFEIFNFKSVLILVW